MKVACVILGAMLCLGMASASYSSSSAHNLGLYLGTKRSLERKGDDEDERRCFGAKCHCEDEELTGGFMATLGNVVSSCEIYRLMTPDEDKRSDEFDVYASGCALVEEIGKRFEAGEYDNQIKSCCEVKEGLVAFHCLNSYMSLAAMRYVRYIAEASGKDVQTAKLVSELEHGMEEQCNSMYGNAECLFLGLTQNFDALKEKCFGEPEDEPKALKMDTIKSLSEQIRNLLKNKNA